MNKFPALSIFAFATTALAFPALASNVQMVNADSVYYTSTGSTGGVQAMNYYDGNSTVQSAASIAPVQYVDAYPINATSAAPQAPAYVALQEPGVSTSVPCANVVPTCPFAEPSAPLMVSTGTVNEVFDSGQFTYTVNDTSPLPAPAPVVATNNYYVIDNGQLYLNGQHNGSAPLKDGQLISYQAGTYEQRTDGLYLDGILVGQAVAAPVTIVSAPPALAPAPQVLPLVAPVTLATAQPVSVAPQFPRYVGGSNRNALSWSQLVADGTVAIETGFVVNIALHGMGDLEVSYPGSSNWAAAQTMMTSGGMRGVLRLGGDCQNLTGDAAKFNVRFTPMGADVPETVRVLKVRPNGRCQPMQMAAAPAQPI